MREGEAPQDFVYSAGENVQTNVCLILRHFLYYEFSGPQDLLQRLGEFTVVATGQVAGELDLSEGGRDWREKLLRGQDGRVRMYLRHIPTWIEQIKILKEEKALELQNQQIKLMEELEDKQSNLKR